MTTTNPTSESPPLRRALLAAVVASAVLAAACGGETDGEGAGDGDETTAAERGEESGDLADCPNPIVIQTNDYPGPEHSALYGLTDGVGRTDRQAGRFIGPLAADPSITVEIRAGRSFIGFSDVIAVMAADDDILLGQVDTDEAIVRYDDFPTTAVVAPLEISPRMLMWSPDAHAIETWSDVGDSEAAIRHTARAPYASFLVDAGLTSADQMEGQHDGTARQFVAEGGALIQEGTATRDPYLYENVLSDWGRPVDFLLIHDAGYEVYAGPLVVLDSRLDETTSSCLAALVPLVQQSIVDVQHDPTATNAAITATAVEIASPQPLSEGVMAAGVVRMGALQIVDNGPGQAIGDFDLDRVAGVIAVVGEQVSSTAVADGLSAQMLVTNRFIDDGIGL